MRLRFPLNVCVLLCFALRLVSAWPQETDDAAQRDLARWRVAREQDQQAAYLDYLKEFPAGLFRAAALARLAGSPSTMPVPVAKPANASPPVDARFPAQHIHTISGPCQGTLMITNDGVSFDGQHGLHLRKSEVQGAGPCVGKGSLTGTVCILTLDGKRTQFLINAPVQSFVDAVQSHWHKTPTGGQ